MPAEFDEPAGSETPEVEYAIEGDPSFDSEATVDQGEMGGEGAGGQGAESSPAAVPSEITNRLAALERMQGAYELLMQRMFPNGQPQTEQKAPIDPSKITTVEELLAYNQQLLQNHQAGIEQAGQRAASEARARGLFTDQAVGSGYGYDSLVARHITPLVKARPQVGQLLAMQDDPATASYFLAIFHELSQRLGGDPVRTAKTLLGTVNAKRQGGQDVLKSINQATRRAARNITKAGGGAGGKQVLSADAIRDMSDEDFARLERQVSNRF